MRKVFVLIVFEIMMLVGALNAQTLFPSYLPIYNDSEVPRIDILIQNSYLDSLYWPGNELNDVEYKATFIFTSGQAADTVNDVGIRLRGNTSRFSQKKSFKISFNTFVEGRKLHGLEKMNLNGEHNDPSVTRSKIFWDMLYSFGVPAPRANHVRLYINGNFYGLYISVEHIDETFIKLHFGNNNGNLYKCLYPADLAYRSSDPNSYKFMADGRRVYDLKTNLDVDNYSDIASLIQIINKTSSADLPEKLEPIFNVNTFLKYLAVEALTGNWDGYSYNKNNFYLYHNTSTGKFEFIPYDVDNTFGIDWFNIDWATRNVTSWANTSEDRPLTKKILAVDVYKKRYLFFLKQLLKNQFKPDTIDNRITNIRNRISQYASIDPYRPLDYGWTPLDFYSSYTQALGAHVKYGLIPYIEKRSQYATSQFTVSNIPPVVYNVNHRAVSYKSTIPIAAMVDDESIPKKVKLVYWVDDGSEHEVDMKRDSSNFYTVRIGPYEKKISTINYYITATDDENQTTREPLYGNYTINFSNYATLSLCINEVMTSNLYTFPDEYGNYSDWVELYNYGTEPVGLGNILITDDLSNPDKCLLPDLTISPGEFILFWADGNPLLGKNHLNFKFNHDGEEVGLFTSKETGSKLIDGYNFEFIPKDQSVGYYPNGKGLPVVLKSPTPGSSNIETSNSVRMMLPEINVNPNPFSNNLTVSLSFKPNSSYTISIYSINGYLLAEKYVDAANAGNDIVWNVGNLGLASGVYLVSVILHEKTSVTLLPKKVIYIPIKQ